MALTGIKDVTPPGSLLWQKVEAKAREIFGSYGFEEIRTPVLEELKLFTRSIGEGTSIVEKEMYQFQDRQGRWLALRPEGTAGVVRAYIESGRVKEDPEARYYYMGPMYRYERPQKGRYRQFHQIGAELFGSESPFVDAELIHMLDIYLKEVGCRDLTLEINSLGCQICRPKYAASFLEFLESRKEKLCKDCHRRLEKNPLRILDCKNEECIELTAAAPSIQDFLCEGCESHLDQVLEGLGILGTPYSINARIVRGLDYYQRTAFEFTTKELGAQNAVAAGGRYDGLVKLLGGPHIPATGFAIGVERVVELLSLRETSAIKPSQTFNLYLAPIGKKAATELLRIANELRQDHVSSKLDYEGRSLKAQLRRADKLGVEHVVILGEEELGKKIALYRNMSRQEQKEVPLSGLTAFLRKLP